MRTFLFMTPLLLGLLVTAAEQSPRQDAPAGDFTVVEATIPQMRQAMADGRTTSRELVVQYLTRIATYEDRLNAVMTVNPQALAEAETRDRERAAGRVRGPLHGIPVALKDIIHTKGL